ncbi:hypothetical protein R1sor_018591 [Riccia sorocarpa]|uniref:ER membrane protein complex subunit 1 n=1 Tax=Riccia sorocarpa TaxID=122646 RepID=A0ABD3IBT5_9MARC
MTLLAMQRSVIGVLILCSVWICSQALYEDQVGVWDWHQQYIGKVKHAVFQTQGSGRKRVIVATDENAIASLNLRTGEVYWRRVLGNSESIDALDLVSGKYVVSLSNEGSSVRAWHLPDGALVWESLLQPSPGPAASLLVLPIDINHDRSNDLLVFSGSMLFAVSSVDGNIIWKSDLQATRKDLVIKKLSLSSEGLLTGVGFSETSGLVTVDIDTRFGEVSKVTPVGVSKALDTAELILINNVAVALDSDLTTVVTALIKTDQDVKVVETPLADLFSGHVRNSQILQTNLEGAFALRVNDKVLVVKVDSSTGQLSVQEVLEGSVVLSDSLHVVDDKHGVAILQAAEEKSSSGKFSLRVVYADSWDTFAVKESVTLDSHRGSVKKVFLNAYLRTDRSYGFRALVVYEDHSLSLLQQGEIVWTREDGLASIIDTWTSELPLEKDRHAVAEVEHDLADWLKGHWLKLKATLLLASPEELAAVQALRLRSSDKNKMFRDHNGFRKLIIVLTKAGKVLALHTGDGRIVWSLLVPGLRSQSDLATTPLRLLPWQVPHRHALDENPIVLVVGRSDGGHAGTGILSWVDVYQGTELRSLKLNFPVKLVVPLPITDASEEQLHLFIDNEHNAHIFPATEESLALFLEHKANVFFYIVDKEKGKIVGYRIKHMVDNFSRRESDGHVFHTEPVWSIVFPSDSEVISSVVSKDPNEAVHTQSKVLSSRDVLYKYLNKNTIFVATVTPKAAQHIGDATPEEAGLVAYLIDTVTGRVLHRVTHPSVQGPVHAVFNENWVVYHYFNLKTYRHEMSVMEIYDQNRVGDKGVVQLMLGKHNATSPVSSYSLPSVEVKSQSYFFTFSVKAMTVTSTARGITGKHILVGTVGDQLLALDKRFVDPRRTLSPSQEEREEGIIPLTDAIPIFPQSYLTHVHQVEGLRGVLTVPARLESTSLVFAYGLDLFYTRTAPSRIYDSLTEDFSYSLLLITIVALVIAIVVTWILSERKELSEKWK